VRDDRQGRRKVMGHGGFGVQETVGAEHHGLDLELCTHTHTHTDENTWDFWPSLVSVMIGVEATIGDTEEF